MTDDARTELELYQTGMNDSGACPIVNCARHSVAKVTLKPKVKRSSNNNVTDEFQLPAKRLTVKINVNNGNSAINVDNKSFSMMEMDVSVDCSEPGKVPLSSSSPAAVYETFDGQHYSSETELCQALMKMNEHLAFLRKRIHYAENDLKSVIASFDVGLRTATDVTNAQKMTDDARTELELYQTGMNDSGACPIVNGARHSVAKVTLKPKVKRISNNNVTDEFQLPAKRLTVKINVNNGNSAINVDNKFSNLKVDEASDGDASYTPEPKLPPIMVKPGDNLKTKLADINNEFKGDVKIKLAGNILRFSPKILPNIVQLPHFCEPLMRRFS
ncbi:hypothetical protein CEXT_62771 [Caerostris extrusa]|uniref:Uncharacterized protein n=1 Tax=Caerostris extrusa TaxID=172846 RepID=A0AAV4PNJ9_CAEEX|nr:hypothetical protein CEXT_62771 [Caerostris extrusa]